MRASERRDPRFVTLDAVIAVESPDRNVRGPQVSPKVEPVKSVLIPRPEYEARRLAAVEDLRAGMTQADVARKYGITANSTCRWARALKAGKPMLATKATGRKRALDYGALWATAAVSR